MSTKTGNSFAYMQLMPYFANKFMRDKNADGLYWPDLLKDARVAIIRYLRMYLPVTTRGRKLFRDFIFRFP